MSISIFMVTVDCGHDNWYSVESNVDKDFQIKFNPYRFKKMSVWEAASYTANLIANKHDNIWLAFSGGYDSEFLANVFYENKIPFTPIIWRDPHCRESDYAIYWCRERNIKPHLIEKDFMQPDVYKVLSGIIKRFNVEGFFGSFSVVLANIAEKNGGSLITAGGGCFDNPRYPEPFSNKAEFVESDWLVKLVFPEKHISPFLLYTPELSYALVKNVDKSIPIQEGKAKLYDLSFRPKILPYHLVLSDLDMLTPTNKQSDIYPFTLDEYQTLLESYTFT